MFDFNLIYNPPALAGLQHMIFAFEKDFNNRAEYLQY